MQSLGVTMVYVCVCERTGAANWVTYFWINCEDTRGFER